ncbi:CPBP family intramembrane glutamic endopeptidase [Duganella fentianensis]|uniref:CPBP family intramembrane glutamic endopeptidase n=1 Tax=Duganella fentianensis TaxID=2692177 RepID=UPI0032B2738A
MTLDFFRLPFADLVFSLYLLVYFPVDGIRRSLSVKAPKLELSALQSYWRQGRYVLAHLAALLLVCWLENHSAHQLGLAIPPSSAGTWGLGIALIALTVMHFLGTWQESKMSAAELDKLAERLRNLPFIMPQTRMESATYLITMVSMTTTWEVLFRGYLILVLTPLVGLPFSILLAAIAYGAGHGFESSKQFAGSIITSLLFTVGYAYTASLWWLIMLHAAVPVSMLFAVRKLNRTKSIDAVALPVE